VNAQQTVYTTYAGHAFHLASSCRALEMGQGRFTHRVRPLHDLDQLARHQADVRRPDSMAVHLSDRARPRTPQPGRNIMRVERCKKCNARKGTPHKSSCVAARYPSSYPESTLYTTTYSDPSSWTGGCSSSSDNGSGSSSDSGSCG
jgi:hypothetical protein